jgi:uncharacterized protein (DUF1330 family)
MKSNYKVVIALVAGAAIGGAAIQGLHAQAKPPIYHIQEITVSDMEPYLKEFVSKARALGDASDSRSLTTGSGKVTSIEGEPQKSRVVIRQWESLEKLQAFLNSPENQELRKIGDKYAKFRSFAVEGVSR